MRFVGERPFWDYLGLKSLPTRFSRNCNLGFAQRSKSGANSYQGLGNVRGWGLAQISTAGHLDDGTARAVETAADDAIRGCPMFNIERLLCVFSVVALFVLVCLPTNAQQTLGAINGTVTDQSGAVVQKVAVRIRNVGTNLEVNATTKDDGSFEVVDLPIGTYEVTFSKEGFAKEVYSEILVQGNRTSTVNAKLSPGTVSSTVEVSATPLLNETDTTNGYTLGSELIQNIPLGTGSFTQLAILSPGVSADLLAGSGTAAGLGNQSIWANGQRDTSNSFEFNGINATNVFNGKSSSSISSNRVVLNTGESFLSGGDIQTNTSVYGAIGEGLPSPPQETIQELQVNTSMYDASQGANAGAHIELSTKSGTNDYHGQTYEYYQSDIFDANEYFRNAAGEPRLPLNRNVFGGMLGGPIKHDKLFFFASYQGQRVRDSYAGSQQVPLPIGLSDDRTTNGLIAAANSYIDPSGSCGTSGHPACFSGTIDPTASSILNLKLPNGSYLVPSSQTSSASQEASLGYATVVAGPPARLTADQANANIDYNLSSKDRIAGKYYFQRDPTYTPFSASPDNASLLGFPTTLQAGSHVLSLVNTSILTPNLTWEQKFGFIRESAYANTSQDFAPSDINLSLPQGSAKFPTVYIHNMDSNDNALSIGPETNFANAGVFQNQFEGETSLTWVHGRHSISTGFNWVRNQLNVINQNNDVSRITFKNFVTFLEGQVCGPANFCGSSVEPSEVLNGATNRYYRTNQAGAFVQDDFKIRSNLSVDVGLRWDWDGPLTEKNGMLTNFYPQDFSYSAATDSFSNIGLVVAGNNPTFGTKGVSDSTMTGRQWGFGPRIGLVYSPRFVKNLVVRTGFGMYYDRGEFFTELSPAAGGGISGPFGVTVEEPFVVPFYAIGGAPFAAPFGTGSLPPPPSGLSGIAQLVPNANQIINNTTTYCQNTNQFSCGGLYFGGYDPRNTLPYSENWTLDLQWQPYNTLVIDVAYVGNHGVHEVLPIPFNQAQIATPTSPALSGGPNQQNYSYGYNVNCAYLYPESCSPSHLAAAAPLPLAAESVNTLVGGYGTGNVALRVPYIGFDPNSDFNEAIGISRYNALQVGVNKRLSYGLMINASYTWSHTLDEGSGLGLFYNGNNPLDPATAYGSSDFDRTHVFTVSYVYQFPKMAKATGALDKIVNGWGVDGITVAQSGQPYSVIDFSGGVASLYWGGGNDLITNPIVPVGGLGSTSTSPKLQGTTGINANNPVLNAAAFGPTTPFAAGTNGVPPCDPTSGVCDVYENGYASSGRNAFRGPFQARFDFSVFKDFNLTERFRLRFDAQFFNLFNHPSFDTPNNNVSFNPDYDNPPIYGSSAIADPSYSPCVQSTGAYACPPSGQLGVIQHTLGSPRFIQFALHLNF